MGDRSIKLQAHQKVSWSTLMPACCILVLKSSMRSCASFSSAWQAVAIAL